MSTTISSSHNSSTYSSTMAYTEQPVPTQDAEPNDLMTGFFAIGMAINIIMITAYFIWAYRQWGKSSKKNK